MTVTPTSTSDASEARHIASKATVYYNSACPVCNAGICAMQERTASDKGIEWIDVHRNPEVLDALGLQLEDVRERLHFADSDGRMRVGADAGRGRCGRRSFAASTPLASLCCAAALVGPAVSRSSCV